MITMIDYFFHSLNCVEYISIFFENYKLIEKNRITTIGHQNIHNFRMYLIFFFFKFLAISHIKCLKCNNISIIIKDFVFEFIQF